MVFEGVLIAQQDKLVFIFFILTDKPIITSVTDSGFDKEVTFSLSHDQLNNFKRYHIFYQLKGEQNWIDAELSNHNNTPRYGENKVTIKSPISYESKDCEYRISLKYRHLSGQNISNSFQSRIKSIGIFFYSGVARGRCPIGWCVHGGYTYIDLVHVI